MCRFLIPNSTPNWIKNVEITHRNLFTVSGKVWLSLQDVAVIALIDTQLTATQQHFAISCN
jgi:hypothetical protein